MQGTALTKNDPQIDAKINTKLSMHHKQDHSKEVKYKKILPKFDSIVSLTTTFFSPKLLTSLLAQYSKQTAKAHKLSLA